MAKLRQFAARLSLVSSICLLVCSAGGCYAWPGIPFGGELLYGFAQQTWNFMLFWEVAPFVPVAPYFSQKVEDAYWEEERYGKVPILDPVEGEHAPLFCMDSPSPDEVVRALPDEVDGGVPFLAETTRNNMRMVVEPIVDRIDECRFYPLVGPAKLHHCHYKCTVFYEKTIRSNWPIPFTHTDNVQEVVYIDHDHLIRCAGSDVIR
jgi:hypothetical protein